MVIKQAEDEITAAQMVSGAMHMGTRALTATSGGGFDLMSETVSLNGIIENPTVFVLAQRPGPATGLPTWTAQADLLMAVDTAHGEFTRCVLSVSDSQDAFDLMPIAFNLAEKYQISVIVLTDKQISEALYTQKPYEMKNATLDRGKLITDTKKLKTLKATDRYDPKAENGISPRWLPGSDAATYCAQGDEHSSDGTVDESARNALEQIEKRMKKMDALKKELPEPELFGAKDPELLVVGWGSTKGAVLDALKSDDLSEKKISYLHYTYVWPLKTDVFDRLQRSAKRVVLIEGNYQGQLGLLLQQQCRASFHDKILKYDGRPFFYDEVVSSLLTQWKSL
jgi:2-oxoglutarate ferredoxin oxidoreductase subunit alpha